MGASATVQGCRTPRHIVRRTGWECALRQDISYVLVCGGGPSGKPTTAALYLQEYDWQSSVGRTSVQFGRNCCGRHNLNIAAGETSADLQFDKVGPRQGDSVKPCAVCTGTGSTAGRTTRPSSAARCSSSRWRATCSRTPTSTMSMSPASRRGFVTDLLADGAGRLIFDRSVERMPNMPVQCLYVRVCSGEECPYTIQWPCTRHCTRHMLM